MGLLSDSTTNLALRGGTVLKLVNSGLIPAFLSRMFRSFFLPHLASDSRMQWGVPLAIGHPLGRSLTLPFDFKGFRHIGNPQNSLSCRRLLDNMESNSTCFTSLVVHSRDLRASWILQRTADNNLLTQGTSHFCHWRGSLLVLDGSDFLLFHTYPACFYCVSKKIDTLLHECTFFLLHI